MSELRLIETKINSPPILLSALGASNEKNGRRETFELAEIGLILTRLRYRGMVAAIFGSTKPWLIGSRAWKKSAKGGNHEAPKFKFDLPFSSAHAFGI